MQKHIENRRLFPNKEKQKRWPTNSREMWHDRFYRAFVYRVSYIGNLPNNIESNSHTKNGLLARLKVSKIFRIDNVASKSEIKYFIAEILANA